MATVPAEVQGPSDGELLEEVRGGSSTAYAQLYERHVGAAYNMARQVAKSSAEADDLVSEAFAKVLDTLRGGRGPTTAFRAYLLTALRHTAYDRTRRERKVQLADDVAEVSGADVSVPFTDTAVAGLERTLAAQAFARLPERWQTVLWHIEVEGQTPATVAPLLGLTPNGVSALAYRAREGLRQAYLQVHLGQLDDAESGVEQCRAAVDRLGAWTRSGLSKRETAQVETHLDGCDRCRALAAELADVNGALRAIIGPLVLGASTTGYLAVSSSGGATASAATTGGASAAANAASTGPRQAVTAVVATGVLAAAVAIAMTSGTDQPVPVAAAPPPPAVSSPAPPAQQPPARPTRQTPPPAPSPAPPTTTPALNAVGPGAPVQLAAGGNPVALPIKVSNTGSGPSEPVTATLNLPSGVTATLPTAVQSGPASTTPQSATTVRAQAPDAPSVRCTNRPGTITCSTDRGLRPGETFVFDYRIRADETATGGEITGSIVAGTEIQLRVPTISVVVQPTPVDGVDVETSDWNHAPWLQSRIDINVRNTGTSGGRAEAVAELPEGVRATGLPPECEVQPAEHRIRCSAELDVGKSFQGRVWLTTLPVHPSWPGKPDPVDGRIVREVTIPVTATLGSASDSDPISVQLWYPPEPPPEPVPPPTTTSRPPMPTSTPPECPPDGGNRPPWRPTYCWWPVPPSPIPPTTSAPPTTSTTSPSAPLTSTTTPPPEPSTNAEPPTSSTPEPQSR
ncbi:sigma-70 family RNA polymerase sigma factor [Saccharopolyspora sp. K220]|uniref:sigma-70 family RNA polymerase sigma factor n=1 Tax=Saccharopolyspora soli TaxID=2926618 RepID=UPI001F5826F5|nr:sigma-70 family RNA polymerase sigma factor [Saccharopolyspora soli]MCI2422203.1 sigma-70 family RNA polymerase sigma factor [Saccharopolyspora soli]